MTSSPDVKPAATVGQLVGRRLRELKRTAGELAAAVEVPADYIDDLIAGSRRPPLPGRTDIYPKMTTFLRLGRMEVAACARAERAGDAAAPTGPGTHVREQLLALCEPGTARTLERRRTRRGGGGAVELAGFLQRVLDVIQGVVRRALDDPIGMRLAAAGQGSTYLATRFKVLVFLDQTADMLTAADLTEFLRPRIARWDVDLETGVVRVVLRGPAPRERARRVAGA
jgi:hypothetical protein